MIDKLIITLFIGVLVNSLVVLFAPKKIGEAFVYIIYGQTVGIVLLVLYQLISGML